LIFIAESEIKLCVVITIFLFLMWADQGAVKYPYNAISMPLKPVKSEVQPSNMNY